MSKVEKLADLANKRRGSPWVGYTDVSDYHNGKYDGEYVSPYTKGAHNVDADVFLLLQDWLSSDWIRKEFDQETSDLGRNPNLPTNQKLEALLQRTFGSTLDQTYATNLFPFIKPGGLSAKIPMVDLVRAAHEFAIPQIEIVQPKLVVCFGMNVFNAVREATGRDHAGWFEAALAMNFPLAGARVWCQAHPGSYGQLNRRRARATLEQDWAEMRSTMCEPTNGSNPLDRFGWRAISQIEIISVPRKGRPSNS